MKRQKVIETADPPVGWGEIQGLIPLSRTENTGPQPSTCENYTVISIRWTTKTDWDETKEEEDIGSGSYRRTRWDVGVGRGVGGCFSPFSTEDLASRDLCVPVYMRKTEKKWTTTTHTIKKKKKKKKSCTNFDNVTRNPLASVLLWSPLSRLYRDCVDGWWDAEQSRQPGDEQELCKIKILGRGRWRQMWKLTVWSRDDVQYYTLCISSFNDLTVVYMTFLFFFSRSFFFYFWFPLFFRCG